MTVEVIIPTYRPGREFARLLEGLDSQTRKPDRISIWNTEEKYWDFSLEKRYPFLIVHHISRAEFDHGGTRQRAAKESKSDFVVYMTQDAIPEDPYLLERLIAPLMEDDTIGAAYARQLPKLDCRTLEKMTRDFNYPAVSHVREESDKKIYGIKTYFCSNVCAVYRRSELLRLGGFPMRTIFNEDMIYCGHLLQAGGKAAYCADARVRHSHNYSLLQQFHRNFDLGVSQAQFPEVFASISSEKEGGRMLSTTCRRLKKENKIYLIPEFFVVSAFKYAGYLLGKHYRLLPEKVCRCFSMNKAWWN